MTFRNKLQRGFWISEILPFVIMGGSFSTLDHHFAVKHGMVFLFAATASFSLFSIAASFFDYLELDDVCLREHGISLPKKARIPLADVTLVRRYGLTFSDLVIEYTRHNPNSNHGSIVVNPKDREGFVAALRQLSPQATFDL